MVSCFLRCYCFFVMAAIHINISPRHRQESQQRHHHACGLYGGREFSGWRLGLHRQQAGSGGLRLWPDAPAADEYRCRQGHAVADAERPGHTEQTAGNRLFGQRHGERGMPDHFGADRQRRLGRKVRGRSPVPRRECLERGDLLPLLGQLGQGLFGLG